MRLQWLLNLLVLTAALFLVSVTACGGGNQDWNGIFYNYLDDENIHGYRYTLKGDTLTVSYVNGDEALDMDFSGVYKRGEAVREAFGLGDDYEEDMLSGEKAYLPKYSPKLCF